MSFRRGFLAVALVAMTHAVTAQTATPKPVPKTTTAPATKPAAGTTQKASPSVPTTTAKPAASKPATKPATKPAQPAKPKPKPAAAPKTATAPKTSTPAKPVAPSTPPAPKAAPVSAPPLPAPVPAQQATALPPPTTASAALPGGSLGDQGGSFASRHPVVSGFVAGLGGVWLADTLLGGTGEAPAAEGASAASPPAETAGLAARLALLGGLGYLVYTGVRARQRPVRRAAAGQGRSTPEVSEWTAPPVDEPQVGSLEALDEPLSVADEQDFADIVTAVQLAWGRGHTAEMRGYLSPEMAEYFDKALATNLDHGVENRVEQVWDVRVAPLSDRWDGELRYVTARVRWMAIDYTVDLSKLASEPGFIIDGSQSTPAECEEVWTFAKARDGAWLLSGIEQGEEHGA
jgi:predicted lipid-binding transport protein (Tim44 family)